MAQILIEPPFETAVAPVDMDALEPLYTIRKRPEVERFLLQRPFLLPLLAQAPDEVRAVFGPNARLALQLARDYDSGAEGDELIIAIDSGEDWQAADDTLRILQRGWWHNVFRQAQGKLDIDLDYWEPRDDV